MLIGDDRITFGGIERTIASLATLGAFSAAATFGLWCWSMSDRVLVNETSISHVKEQVGLIREDTAKARGYWEDWLRERKK